MVESMQALSAIAPILVILTPYIYGFHSQAPSRKWLRSVFKELTGEIPVALQNRKRAWFTDTLEDVNGVATTIRKMTAAGAAAGKELVVVASQSDLQLSDIPIKNFPPIGEFELPEYELQKLSFPPILQMLDYIQRERFTEIIISTPGPVGLTALLAAKMLNLQTSGIYHTDFPQYIRILTEDSFLESVAWRYMHWFYGQLDTVFVNSEEYRQSWIKRGFDPAKLKDFAARPRHRAVSSCSTRLRASSKNSARRTVRFACSMSAAFHERKTSIFWPPLIAVCAMKDCRFSFSSLVMARIPKRSRSLCLKRFSPATSEAKNWPRRTRRPTFLFFPAPPTHSAT